MNPTFKKADQMKFICYTQKTKMQLKVYQFLLTIMLQGKWNIKTRNSTNVKIK